MLLPWSLPFRSFFQVANSISGHRGVGQHNSYPPASAEVVLIWLSGTANLNSGNKVWWTSVWAAQVYCASQSTDKTLRGASAGRWAWLCAPTDPGSRATVHPGAVNISSCVQCSHYYWWQPPNLKLSVVSEGEKRGLAALQSQLGQQSEQTRSAENCSAELALLLALSGT